MPEQLKGRKMPIRLEPYEDQFKVHFRVSHHPGMEIVLHPENCTIDGTPVCGIGIGEVMDEDERMEWIIVDDTIFLGEYAQLTDVTINDDPMGPRTYFLELRGEV